MQALDRTQPGLPLKKGRCGTMTHDYKRNGTTTLFAALNILDGSVIGTCMPKHRHQEFVNWLKRNKRFHVHFTPTSASWLNMVERFFRDLSEQRLRRRFLFSSHDAANILRLPSTSPDSTKPLSGKPGAVQSTRTTGSRPSKSPVVSNALSCAPSAKS